MGDAGEGLIDAEGRIQERREEMERAREEKKSAPISHPELVRELESLRLAKAELDRQFATVDNDRRKAMIGDALKEIARRMADVQKRMIG